MEGRERRERIIDILKNSDEPLAGTERAARLKVSRQVIVQDIALLRAVDKNIISTNKGYMFFEPHEAMCRRIFMVKHTDEQMRDELNSIVDNGGQVLDVIIEHDVYGPITVDLQLSTRHDVDEFMERIMGNARPLKYLTDGVHYHTVEAESEKALDRIENVLKQKGYLISV